MFLLKPYDNEEIEKEYITKDIYNYLVKELPEIFKEEKILQFIIHLIKNYKEDKIVLQHIDLLNLFGKARSISKYLDKTKYLLNGFRFKSPTKDLSIEVIHIGFSPELISLIKDIPNIETQDLVHYKTGNRYGYYFINEINELQFTSLDEMWKF